MRPSTSCTLRRQRFSSAWPFAVAAVPYLAGGMVLEAAFGVQRGQRCFQVLGVLGLDVAAHEGGELFVHGGISSIFDI